MKLYEFQIEAIEYFKSKTGATIMLIGGKTKKAHKATQPQFVVESGYGTNEYMKIENGLLTWVGDVNSANKYSSKFAAKERVRDIEGLPATRCFKEL